MQSPVCARRQSREHSPFSLVDRAVHLRDCGDSDNIGFVSFESTADHCLATGRVVALLCAAQYGALSAVSARNVSSRSRDKLISRQTPAILL